MKKVKKWSGHQKKRVCNKESDWLQKECKKRGIKEVEFMGLDKRAESSIIKAQKKERI